MRKSSRLLAIAAVAFSVAFLLVPCASADGITYTWVGNNGATGSFSLDSSLFNGTATDQIDQSELTAFSFNIGGVMFDFGDVLSSAAINFDSTFNPPKYEDGAGGDAAKDGAGDTLVFFPDDIRVFFASGGSLTSTGDFVVESPTATPEPATLTLVGAGLIGIAARRRKRRLS
jgi:PEP-CTERM motif